MNTSDVPPARFRLAIALSIAAHLCVLGLLAVLLDDRFVVLSSDTDGGSANFITTIEHRMRIAPAGSRTLHPVARPTHAPVALVERPHPAEPPPPQERRQPRAAQPQSPVKPGARSVASVNRALPGRRQASRQRPTLALVEATPAATPTAEAPPSPAPTAAAATPSPAPAATRSPATVVAASFGGLFSADYPPALVAPSDIAEIRTLVGGPARIRIDVDETGQATDVHFISPIADPQIAQAVRDKLLALHYVPADCNGLHCEGSLELRF